ncbi:hypothetical protein Save01_08476 [Streptomyces avermitilis]|uniref:CobQ/CobB/MinD/ParA nucleotide binding domain-containing protein n=2 Tax=Streptomyces avermitilis TaxID=33903 RepID=A0A143T0P5_STRAW|nr:hypothetical protein SAVERM_2p161 [Streptomyces avermitilis MA-4680 = NBRC 14893]GDY80580.1 hypothetical protein SAV31267_100650 [Streptomyces avermitilis]
MSTPPAPVPPPPSWTYCAHGADPTADPVGCRGIHVPGHTACLAHLSDTDRDTYLASLTPGDDIDHSGTLFTEDLLGQLLNALRDPTTGNPQIGTARFAGTQFFGTAWFHSAQFFGIVVFDGAQFSGTAVFGGAVLLRRRVRPGGRGGIEIQAAVEQGIDDWCSLASATATVDTGGADSFSTFLPPGQWEEFRQIAADRRVSLIQGLAQSVQLWLDTNPTPDIERPSITRRVIVCNQKGGVGKTAITAGLGEALAEDPNST